MNKFIKSLLIITTTLLIGSSTIKAQVTMGSTQVSGNFEVTNQVVFSGEKPTSGVAAMVSDNTGALSGYEMVEVSVSSTTIRLRVGNGEEPNIPTNADALVVDTINNIYMKIYDWNTSQVIDTIFIGIP